MRSSLEFIPNDPHTTGGTTKIVFAVKSVRLKTLTEVGSTFNSGQVDWYKLKKFLTERYCL